MSRETQTILLNREDITYCKCPSLRWTFAILSWNATGRLYLNTLNIVTGWLPKNNYVVYSNCKAQLALSMLVTTYRLSKKSIYRFCHTFGDSCIKYMCLPLKNNIH